jgi:hypothetical protein
MRSSTMLEIARDGSAADAPAPDRTIAGRASKVRARSLDVAKEPVHG